MLATYAGLRVLPRNDGSTVDARRETAILVGKGGMLTVAGGKLTTYRQIAYSTRSSTSRPPSGSTGSTVGRCRCRARRMQATWPRASSAAGSSSRSWPPISPTSTARGRTASSALAADRPELLERLHPDAPDIGAQVVFAAREEWATSAADVLHRRTTLAARGLTGGDVASRVEELLVAAAPGELRRGAAL